MIGKMKAVLTWAGFLLIVLTVSACAGGLTARGDESTEDGAGTAKNSATIADIQDRDWILEEVQSNSGSVRINRTRPGAAEVYTLRFDAERVSGMAAPNRYFAPYTKGEGKALSIGMVAGTLMAPLFENEDLREHEYFGYLSRVNRWDLRNGKLELYTSAENGNEIVLVYNVN